MKAVPVPQLLDECYRVLGPERLCEANKATLPDFHCVWNVKQALNAGRHLARWGCSAVQYNNRLHIFGGRGNDSEPRNSFHVLDLDSLEISKMNTQNLPKAREGHSCIAYKDSLIVYGGCYGGDDDPTRYNDVCILDLKAKKWTLQKTTGNGPPGQDGHVAALVDDKMIIYGGSSEKVLLGSIYALNLKQFSWEQLDIEGDDPMPRESMGLAACKSTLYIFGGNVNNPGETDLYTNDFFRLEIRGKKVKSKRIVPLGQSPCPRLSHSLTLLKPNCLALFGGESSEKLLDDIWIYLILQNMWVELKPERPIAPRIAHVASAFQGKLLIYGGMGAGRTQTVKSDISILTFTDEVGETRQRPKRANNRYSIKREMEESKSSSASEVKLDSPDDVCGGCGHNNVTCNFLTEHPELGHISVFFYAQCQIPLDLMEQLCSSYVNPSLTLMRIADVLEGEAISIKTGQTVELRKGEIVKCPLGPQPIDFSFLPVDPNDDTLLLRSQKISSWHSTPTTPATVLQIHSPKPFPPDTVAMMMTGTYEENLISPLLALSCQALMVSRGEEGLAVALTCRMDTNIPCFFVAFNQDMSPLFPSKTVFYPNLAEILNKGHLTLEEIRACDSGTTIFLYMEGVLQDADLFITNKFQETYNLTKDLARACFRPPSRQQFFLQTRPVIAEFDETAVISHSDHRFSDRQFKYTYWTESMETAQVRVYHENRLVFCTPVTFSARRKRNREETTVAIIEIRDPKLVLHRSKVIRWNETTIGIINRVRDEAMKTT